MGERRTFQTNTSERLPKWIRKASFFEELPEIIKDSRVDAAFYVPPPHPQREIFEKVAKETSGETTTSFKNTTLSEMLNTLFKFTRDPTENDSIVLQAVCEDIEKINEIFPENEVAKVRLDQSHYATPYDITESYDAGLIDRAKKINDQELVGWHSDGCEPGMLKWRLLRTYFGPSTEYAEDENGTNRVVLPSEAVAIHRRSHDEYGRLLKTKGAIHRTPRAKLGVSRLLAVFGLRAKN